MSNLKLVTTETFNGLDCNFYRNMNDEILLTREQIGQALEYADPIKAIQQIHRKHKDRLNDLSVRIKTDTFDYLQTEVGRNNNLQTERVYYTERGVMEICRWSRQPNANMFMDWVWDVVEKYRHNQLQPFDVHELSNTISSMVKTLDALTKSVLIMQQNLKSQNNTQSKLPQKKWSYWSTKMFPKYQLLTDYFNISNGELYKNLYRELQNEYPYIDLNQYIADYCYENNLESAYTLDVIEHNFTLRKLFESIVDNLLKRYELIDSQEVNIKLPTIFDMGIKEK